METGQETYLDYLEPDDTKEWDSLVSLKLITHNTRLVEARNAKKVSQGQMAKDISMGLLRLSRIENLHLVPNEEDMAKIAVYLEQPIDYLFTPLLMKAIEDGVFTRRDAQLTEPQIMSLDEAARLQLTYDGESEIIDQVSRHLLTEQITELTHDALTPRERRVIELRFGLTDGQSRTQEEVGNEFHLTSSRISAIEHNILRRLRHSKWSQRLKDYLE
jgi:DNA-directed RNA polymerase sigma subunit (sigma70/sigma32)